MGLNENGLERKVDKRRNVNGSYEVLRTSVIKGKRKLKLWRHTQSTHPESHNSFIPNSQKPESTQASVSGRLDRHTAVCAS